MAGYIRNDQVLLAEAYQVQLLKENIREMSITQVRANIDLMCESEKQWVTQFSERVIEELFGGLKSLMGAGSKTLGGARDAVAGAGKRAVGAVTGAAQKAGQTVADAGRGVAAAGKQFAGNVADRYAAGEQANTSGKHLEQAEIMVGKLIEMLKAAQSQGLLTFSGDPMTMPLSEVIDELVLAKKGAESINRSKQKAGLTQGMGKAFQSQFG